MKDMAKIMFDQEPRPHEKELVSLYTPSLMQILNEVSPDLRLVNSEYFPWLQCVSGHRSSDLKPDLFSGHHSLVQFLPAYARAPACVVPRFFGKFASWESRGSIHCIWDAKWKIDMKAFGEKCKYLQIAGEDCVDYNDVAVKLKGVLFDVEEFWMIRSSGNTIVDVVKCPWTQSGSKQQLVNFLHVADPWLEALSCLCDALGVTILDLSSSPPTKEGQTAFLGSGANGRVFKLSSGPVIKIVVGRKADNVEKEYKMMLKYLTDPAYQQIQSLVFPVVESTFRDGVVCGGVSYAGYMLGQEGCKIVRPLSDEVKTELAAALYGLHSCDVIHGDPRIENALTLDGTLKWIDFRHSEVVTGKMSRRRDVEILYKSIYGETISAEDANVYMNEPTFDRLWTVLLKK